MSKPVVAFSPGSLDPAYPPELVSGALAAAARSQGEDGSASARPSPRPVIRGESTSPPSSPIGSLAHENAWAP